MANAKNAKTIAAPTTASNKASKAFASVSLSQLASAASSRAVGSGAGYKGKRTLPEAVQALQASGLDLDTPAAAVVAMALAIGSGWLRWVLVPNDDGTFSSGKAPLAPAKHKELPEGAAVAKIPACGAFGGGLEVVAQGTIQGKKTSKQGLCLYRMVKGSLAPVVCLVEDDSKAHKELLETAKAASLEPVVVALLAHIASNNQGGAILAAAKASKGAK